MSEDKTTPPPTLKEFADRIESIRDEAGCNGERIGSHNIRSRVTFHDMEGNTYILKHIDVWQLPGCGCWDGARIILEREPDDAE